MRPKQRIRKIYTQSDMSQRPIQGDENLLKMNNINIKDLELNLSENKEGGSQSKNNKNTMYKNAHFYMPNKFNKINRKQLIKKLPDINLTSLSTISKPLKLNPLDQRTQDRFSNTKKNTFLLNSLFQILKPQETFNDKNELNRLKERTMKLGQKKNISIDSFYDNQFINVTNSSTKNRGPKVIENEITRLSNHNNIMRRKIVSEQKSRPKYRDQSIQKLKQTTFQHFKRCIQKDQQQNLTQSQKGIKQNFQNLQIITFYNKFPTLKKKEQQKQCRYQNRQNRQIKANKIHSQGQSQVQQNMSKIIYKSMRNHIKTQIPDYQQENQFIFQKKGENKI